MEIFVYDFLVTEYSGGSFQLQINCIWPKMNTLTVSFRLKKNESGVIQKYKIQLSNVALLIKNPDYAPIFEMR